MSYIYTCQHCSKQYMVDEDGEYLCECGRVFHYPMASSSFKAHLSGLAPSYADSSSAGIRRAGLRPRGRRHNRHFQHLSECPLAKSSLICAVLSIFFFGVLAPPALIMGFAARMMIADKSYHYSGDDLALWGIAIATISLSAWSVWFITLL
ncbi:MAG: DUF4190 domain-containing protein [Victivallales bacterium]|nr:DUF4190 domain-containing protein [Victivallales bacterium]